MWDFLLNGLAGGTPGLRGVVAAAVSSWRLWLGCLHAGGPLLVSCLALVTHVCS